MEDQRRARFQEAPRAHPTLAGRVEQVQRADFQGQTETETERTDWRSQSPRTIQEKRRLQTKEKRGDDDEKKEGEKGITLLSKQEVDEIPAIFLAI